MESKTKTNNIGTSLGGSCEQKPVLYSKFTQRPNISQRRSHGFSHHIIPVYSYSPLPPPPTITWQTSQIPGTGVKVEHLRKTNDGWTSLHTNRKCGHWGKEGEKPFGLKAFGKTSCFKVTLWGCRYFCNCSVTSLTKASNPVGKGLEEPTIEWKLHSTDLMWKTHSHGRGGPWFQSQWSNRVPQDI